MIINKVVYNVAAIILAGGQGTRLFPLTQFRAKPDVSFGGRYRLINVPVSNSINSKVDEIFIISQYFASQLNEHIQKTFSIDGGLIQHLHLLHPEETPHGQIWYEGTADAIRKNLKLFEQHPADYFIILSGDQLYSMDLSKMVDFTIATQSEMTVASIKVSKKEAKRMGLLKLNEEKKILDFFEKPTDESVLSKFALHSGKANEDTYLGSMGIYVFQRECLIKLLNSHSGLDFGKDIIPYQIKNGKKSSSYFYEGYWEDIGTIESFYNANLALTHGSSGLNLYDDKWPIFSEINYFPYSRIETGRLHHTTICEGCMIDALSISHSMIGQRIWIGKETVIEDSILMGNPPSEAHHNWTFQTKTIGDYSVIKGAIIDEYAQIGHNVRLVNDEKLQRYDGDGIFIRDGIIVVASGKKIPDGYHFKPS